MLAVAAAPAVCYSGGGDGTLRAWELPELKPLRTFESKEGGQSIQLVDALCAKSEAIGAAVAAPTMLHAALTPATARLIVRFLDEMGDDAFVAAATAIATEEEQIEYIDAGAAAASRAARPRARRGRWRRWRRRTRAPG